MDFPKKQAQRLMPLYLLEYSEKLFTNHPNPEDPWGGGSDYTAGQGITITNNEISVDTNVIATKSDIPDFSNYYYINNEIQDGEYITKINGNGLEYSKQWTSNSISITANCTEMGFDNKPAIVVKTDPNKKVVVSDSIVVYNEPNSAAGIEGEKVSIHAPNGYVTSLEDGKLVYTDQNGVRNFNLNSNRSSGNYTLAVLEDIPDSPFLKVDDPQDQMFFSLDGSDYSWFKYVNLSDAHNKMFYVNLSALNPVFKDGLTSTYNEQTNQLEVSLNAVIPTKTSDLFNDSGYVTSSEIPTNYVTTDTEQTITGLKTIGETSGTISEVDFSGFTFKLSNKAINHPEADIKIRNGSYDGYQHPIVSSTKGLYVNLAKIRLGDDGNNTYGITMPDSSTWEADRVLATTNDIPTKTSDLFNDSGYVTSSSLATVATTGNYNDLTNKPTIPSSATSTSTSTVTPTTGTFVTGTSTNTTNVVNSVTYTPSSETLTFTYADNTTASFTFLTSNTTVTSGTTSVVTSVTDSTSNAMTDATVSTSTTTTLS